MMRPMGVLAALCVLGSTIALPQAWANLFPFQVEDSDSLRRFLSSVVVGKGAEPSGSSWVVSGQLVMMTALGALPAAFVYLRRPALPRRLVDRLPWPHTLVRNRFYLDVLVDRGLVQPVLTLSDRLLARGLDQQVIDRFVVDGSANLLTRFSERVLKHWEPGALQLYLALMLVGGLALVGWLLFAGGSA
jgi:NADH-quinone oxidoreductase subunit L